MLLRKIVLSLNNHNALVFLSDKADLRLVYWAQLGKRLELDHPTTFNEKMQWLKLYDRNVDYCKMVDKYGM